MPINAIAQELVKFDLQKLENPEISGIQYQQGELLGYEVREYLLDKWDIKCAYCVAENVRLQVEHIHPKAKGGSNRISNLCIACEKCNLKKGTQDINIFLAKKPLSIKATGHGSRQMCRTDKFGIPSRYVPRLKFVKGFQTGDIVKAIVTSGKKIGSYTGRVAVRSTGSFNISASVGLLQGISYKYCEQIHQKDGYNYGFKKG